MSGEVSFGFSPCPNDTFAFHALVHGLVEAPGPVRPFLADVEELNQRALRGEFQLSKLSFPALFQVAGRYVLLRAGAALGRGVGPLLVARRDWRGEVDQAVVAVPGLLTTAFLLLCLYLGRRPRVEVMEFSQVMEAVAAGRVEAGLLIHEGRFTYQRRGLRQLADLGQWWEQDSGLPIPLGCIAARRDMGREAALAWQQALAASVAHAQTHPRDSQQYVLAHAQEMEPEVVEQHIGLYVNDFSRDLGEEGLAAVDELHRRAVEVGVCPPAPAEGLALA